MCTQRMVHCTCATGAILDASQPVSSLDTDRYLSHVGRVGGAAHTQVCESPWEWRQAVTALTQHFYVDPFSEPDQDTPAGPTLVRIGA